VDIKINNNEIIIQNYTPTFSKKLHELLSYTDKSKQYQIKKMSRNAFSRNSDYYKKLVASQEGTLADEQSGVITIPSGFAYLFKNDQFIDDRKDTGKTVAFPWKTKPHEPRDYQYDGITQMCDNYRGLINFATGLGKTLTAVYAIRSIGRRALILCPSKAIADNFYQELCSAFGDNAVGYFGGGKKQMRDITVGIVQSVNNSIDQFAKHDLGLVIFDECFPYRTSVNTEDGPKEIGWLVKQWEENKAIPRIMSFNEITKQFEYKKMTHGWRKIREDLVEIKYSKRKFKCTPEHKLLTSSGWMSAKDIKPGDHLLGMVGNKSERHIAPILNNDQFHIVLGSLLGVSDLGIGLVESVTATFNKVLKGRQPFVFDVEVEDNHNFIICSSNDTSGIIAHNCHHMAADTFFSIATGLGSVGRMFGLTATDFRSDGKDIMIQAGVGEVLIKRDIIWGIENKWLAYPSIIMREVETTGREYPDDKIKNYKSHVLNSPEMNERIIQDIKKCIEAKKSVLCLVDEKEHGRLLSEALGLPLATGDDKNSKVYVQQLNDGTIPGLIGTDSLIGEGCDTRNVDVLVLANFVASKGPLWQNLGRGLRRQGTKKTVLVLDYKPTGSKMLSRHADQRLKLYKAITSSVREV